MRLLVHASSVRRALHVSISMMRPFADLSWPAVLGNQSLNEHIFQAPFASWTITLRIAQGWRVLSLFWATSLLAPALVGALDHPVRKLILKVNDL